MTVMHERSRRLRGEDGAVLLLVAVVLLVLLGMAALVVDLGFLYVDSRRAEGAADFGATAGAASLDPGKGGTPQQACEDAWAYTLMNLPDVGPTSSPCGAFAGVTTCDPFSAARATADIGPYTVEIVIPVPDTDPLMEGRLGPPTVDGSPCDRVGVEVTRDRDLFFAGVMGTGSSSSSAHAVARAANRTAGGDLVALVLLDPVGCRALEAKGQAQVVVESTISASGDPAPGMITIDSAGTYTGNPQSRDCSNSSQDFTVDAVGTQNSRIEAQSTTTPTGFTIPGVIYSFALLPGNSPANAFDQADVDGGRLIPRPIPGARIGRTPVDHRYNCKASNGCPDVATQDPYIDQLVTAYGGPGAPAGFQTYGDDDAEVCSTQGSDPPIDLSGNWWINCPGGFTVKNAVTLSGGDMVFEGSVTVGSGGSLAINADVADDRVVYIRDGIFSKDAQASITMDQTMVFLANGAIEFGAGSGTLRWIAPLSGSFEDLALWSESSTAHLLGGQAALDIEGAFFTPNAFPFEFKGQGVQQQAKAQFVTFRLAITGQGQLLMRPDPDRVVPISLSGTGLIR